MGTRKIYERINWYIKDYIHEKYTRIVYNFKDYEKISRVKMVEEVYKIYDNYNNIIDICTTRELKYLKSIVEGKITFNEENNKKYKWESDTLHSKFLLEYDSSKKEYFVPDEIIDKIKEAVKNIDWNIAKRKDDLNILLVGYCKTQGSTLVDTLVSLGESITKMPKNVIESFIYNNRVFRYYVMLYNKNIEPLGGNFQIALYQDYYAIEEELEEERKKQGLAGELKIDLEEYKILFYNDFNIKNNKIKKMLEESEKLPCYNGNILRQVREVAMLNINREPLKESIASIPSLKNYDLTKFFKVLDEAMDEMPSGALNGFTPNEAKKIRVKELKSKINKDKNYIRQTDACLSKKDAKLFYKIYFGLLEFTNEKYKIKSNLKIYNKEGINPYEISEIVDKLWKNKENIVEEFCHVNPYKFSSEELEVTRNFKDGIRGLFIIIKFEEEYTAFMNENKVYMIKGINDNLDNVISYKKLPSPVITTIIPFKKYLIYDGMLSEPSIRMGTDFERLVEEEYSKAIKYYHL